MGRTHRTVPCAFQNDVWGIADELGELVVIYQYDAWGVVTACYDISEDDIANVNPITYRSYYMDIELGFFMYYLNSRYYLADWGRFVSGDSVVAGVGGDQLGYNMFAYCQNNPVNYCDPNGNWLTWATKAIVVATVAIAVVAAVAVTVATFGAGSVAGVAAITACLTIAAKATEVVALQVKKNKAENKKNSQQSDTTEDDLISNKQIAKNAVESLYDNGLRVHRGRFSVFDNSNT